MANWHKVDRRTITVSYEEASIAFVCPCGTEVAIYDEPHTCSDCGRRYRYVVQLQVQEDERA